MATPELSMILSIPQLRLSLNMLGYTHWHDLPLIDTDESVEQRLMNAFLHLVQTGHLINAEGGYRMAPGFEQLMTNIGQADNVYHLCEEQRILAFFYEKDGKTVVLSPDRGHWEHCRLMQYRDAVPADIAAVMAEEMQPLQLLRAETTGNDPDGYDLEKLAFFLAVSAESEEAE